MELGPVKSGSGDDVSNLYYGMRWSKLRREKD